MAGLGFGEGISPTPEEERKEELPQGVRGLEDAAAKTLARAEKPAALEAAESETRLEKEAQELRPEVEKIPEAEREKISFGLRNMGFFAEEAKGEWMAKGLEWFTKTAMHEKGTAAKFVSSLAETYRNDAKKARERIEAVEKSKQRQTLANAGYLVGNAVKIARPIADVVGWTAAAPLRYVMMGGMFFARGADAAKELRLKNEEVIAKTRIEDADKAADEAWKVHDAAKVRAGGAEISAKDFAKAYQDQLPKDILERLNSKTPEQPSLMNRVVQGILKTHIERSVKRLERKTATIEDNVNLSTKEKKAKRERLFNRFERRLRDYDRVVGQFGTVDALAMGARYAEVGAKVAIGAAVAETLFLSLDRVLGGPMAEFLEQQEMKDAAEGLYETPAGEVPPVGTLPSGMESGAAPKMQGEIFADLEHHAAPSEIAPIDSTAVKPPSLEEVPAPGAKETAEAALSKAGGGNLLNELYEKHPEFKGDTTWHVGKSGLITREGYGGWYLADKEGNLWWSGGKLPSGELSGPQILKLGTTEWAETDQMAAPAPKEMIEEAANREIGEKEIEVEPKVAKPSSGVMESKLVERAIPVTEEELRAVKEMKAAFEISPEQAELATIGKGEGVTHAIVRQLKVDPEKFGYDRKGGVDLDKWAILKSKEIAIDNGYIRPDGSEIRVLDQGAKGNPAYLLDQDAYGRFHVREFLGGKPSGGGKLSPYEYEWKKPKLSELTERSKAPLEKIPEKSAFKAVSELPARQAAEAAATGSLHEVSVPGAADVIGSVEIKAPVPEHATGGKTLEMKLPGWLTERVEYAKLAETLPEKTAGLEALEDNFDYYSLAEQEHAAGTFSEFEKQLDYLEKHADTLGLTPAQEDFIEMSKTAIAEMEEALAESQRAFREQLEELGVSPTSYEKSIAMKGITVNDLFNMEKEHSLDEKKWGVFVRWLHELHPTAGEGRMEADKFLKGNIRNGEFEFIKASELTPEVPIDTIGVHQAELNVFLHGLVDENLNELNENIPRYATVLDMKPEEVEQALTELGKIKDIAGGLNKLTVEHPEQARLLSKILEAEPELKPEAQTIKRTLDILLGPKQ
jgi:hypothetical protein